jgi:hypothetical protein
LIAGQAKGLSELGLAANESLSQQTWSAFSGLRTIHVFGGEGFEVKRFDEGSDNVRHLFFRMALISMTTGPVTEIFVTRIGGPLALLAWLAGDADARIKMGQRARARAEALARPHQVRQYDTLYQEALRIEALLFTQGIRKRPSLRSKAAEDVNCRGVPASNTGLRRQATWMR